MTLGAVQLTNRVAQVLMPFIHHPDEAWFGTQLMKRLHMSSGTLYPILARLEKAEFLISFWEPISPLAEARPRRRGYTLNREHEDKILRQLTELFMTTSVFATEGEESHGEATPR